MSSSSSSFLTKEQLDKYVKDLASKKPKTNSLKNASRSPSLSKASPNSPLSPTTTSFSPISTGERKVGGLYGPRSPPPSNRSSFSPPPSNRNSISSLPSSNRNSLTATTSPRTSVFGNKVNENNTDSSLNDVRTTSIPELTTQENNNENISSSSLNEIKPHPIPEPIAQDSNSNDHEEKNSNYKSIDEMVNDLSYPMETKLSFKPTSQSPQSKGNNSVPPPKGADDPIKGSYVLSAAFRSSYSASSRTPSVKKPVIKPSPEQEQRESLLNKNQRDSTIQELQNRPDTNWSARYNEAQQKFPPLNKLDEEVTSQKQKENNITGGVSPAQNSKPIITDSKQSIRTTSMSSKLTCASCDKPISGNVLTALGKKWHPDHFVCKNCGIPLEHVSFFENNGNPYCHLDFHELFSPKCGHCNTPIEGQAINALGKSWHPGHFFCRECGDPFEGGFMVHEGFPYCEKDWTKLFAPKCKGCELPIKGEFMSALDGMWHRECFGCTTCKEPFNSSYYYIFEGKPYCDEHYRNLLSSS